MRFAENLDYLHQMLNGWLLNISPYEHRLGLLRVSTPLRYVFLATRLMTLAESGCLRTIMYHT
jgi:hypothetical protein